MKIMNKDSNTEWKIRRSTVPEKERFKLNELREVSVGEEGEGRETKRDWRQIVLLFGHKSVFGHREQYTLSVASLVCCNWDTTLRERPNEQTGTLRKISKTKLHQQDGQSFHLQCFRTSTNPSALCIYSGSDSLVATFYNKESASKSSKHLNLLPHAEKKGELARISVATMQTTLTLHIFSNRHTSM